MCGISGSCSFFPTCIFLIIYLAAREDVNTLFMLKCQAFTAPWWEKGWGPLDCLVMYTATGQLRSLRTIFSEKRKKTVDEMMAWPPQSPDLNIIKCQGLDEDTEDLWLVLQDVCVCPLATAANYSCCFVLLCLKLVPRCVYFISCFFLVNYYFFHLCEFYSELMWSFTFLWVWHSLWVLCISLTFATKAILLVLILILLIYLCIFDTCWGPWQQFPAPVLGFVSLLHGHFVGLQCHRWPSCC